jgi:hypothetical protein
MKRNLAIALALIIAVLISIAYVTLTSNLLQSNTLNSSTAASSGVKDGLQLSITLEANKTRYELGEELGITFAVTNVSNQTIAFINQNNNSSFNFQVYNSTGDPVYWWFLGAHPVFNASITLAPNENYNETFSWNQISDLTRGFPQVPAGNYYIIGETGDNPPYTLQTDRLNITITNR